MKAESRNPERDREIIALADSGVPLEDIARRFRIGFARVRQIIYRDIPVALDLSRKAQLRAETMAAWHKTGMTYKAIGERYGITGCRVSQCIAKHERRLYREQKHGPKPKVRRIATVTGLEMKPGAIWHTWYLDPSRRETE